MLIDDVELPITRNLDGPLHPDLRGMQIVRVRLERLPGEISTNGHFVAFAGTC
ncbi:MAG: hypothetical protein ACRDTE_01990 [Pseudonocardiaceae bacterium]